MTYYQRIEGNLQGKLDYWVMVGLEKKILKKNKFEIRLNHLCRHLSSLKEPKIFDLNEIFARIWMLNKMINLGLGGGSYTDGGSFTFNLEEASSGALDRRLACVDKFGREVKVPKDQIPYLPGRVYYMMEEEDKGRFDISGFFERAAATYGGLSDQCH